MTRAVTVAGEARPLTPAGKKAIDAGRLDYFSPELFANFNTGAAEKAIEARNRTESYRRSRWSWPRIAVGVAIGVVFAFVNLYNALLFGFVVGGSWYLTYFLGTAFGWRPNDINLSAGAGTAASQVVIGFAMIYPALYFLSDRAGEGVLPREDMPSVAFLSVASVLAALLGILFFVVWRRLWVVERPLPYPGFETGMTLLRLAHQRATGVAVSAARGLRNVVLSTLGFGLFTFLRDWPLRGSAAFDRLFGSRAYGGGVLALPGGGRLFDPSLFYLSPLLAATGWFIGLRVAVAFALGSFVASWVLGPAAIALDAPLQVFGGVPLKEWADANADGDYVGTARSYILQFSGAGVILGATLAVLGRHARFIAGAFRDLRLGRVRRERKPRGGWYESPPLHLAMVLGATLVSFPLLFASQGYSVLAGAAAAVFLIVGVFVLGGVAVKVTGETTVQPLSQVGLLMLLVFVLVFSALGLGRAEVVLLALVGTTVFAAGAIMSTDLLYDFKNALYVGTRPYLQTAAQVVGMVPGVLVGVLAGTFFAVAIADGEVENLNAPKARAFEALALPLAGGDVDYALLGLGLLLGVVLEVALGLGVPFGIGMILPPFLTLPFLAFGALRWGYDRRLARAYPGTEAGDRRRSERLLGTYMIATGAFVGEALLALLVFFVTVAPDIGS